ncbi:MAG: hypothetical protein NTV51_22345, partial [Verrucomicrobia bacterium]|nr:hypothetical protein [Verrucomicrobiota bacterium]
MNTFPESYLIFLGGLGWMFVAWSAVPEVVGRRGVWWLVAFALCAGFGEAIRTTLSQLTGNQASVIESPPGLGYRIAMIAVLLEFLRRLAWPLGAPPLSRWLHVVPAGSVILALFAPLPITTLVTRVVITTLLATGAGFFWWLAPAGDRRRRGLRLAAFGFATSALVNAFNLLLRPDPATVAAGTLTTLGSVAPWLVVLGLTEAFLALLGTRSRAAWFFFVCLALTPFGGPLIQRTIMPRLDAAA